MHHEYACGAERCAQVICFTPEVDARLRRTHEWWYCPAGHRQRFTGKTEQEKRLDQLEAENRRLREAVRSLTIRLACERRCWCGSSFDTARQLNGHRMGADHWTHPTLRGAA